MLFARISKVESNVRSNATNINANTMTIKTTPYRNQIALSKENTKKNSRSNIQLEENIDHGEMMQHLEGQTYTTKNEYLKEDSINRESVRSNRHSFTPTPQTKFQNQHPSYL